jgi:TIR domain
MTFTHSHGTKKEIPKSFLPSKDDGTKNIFISHIHEERKIALEVMRLIHEHRDHSVRVFNLQCYLSSDENQQTAGEEWLKVVKEKLLGADLIILLLSPSSVKRHWVSFEAGAGWIREIKIIPVLYGGLKPNDLPRPYNDFRAILDLTSQWELLINSIWKHLFGASIMTRPPGEAWLRLNTELQALRKSDSLPE